MSNHSVTVIVIHGKVKLDPPGKYELRPGETLTLRTETPKPLHHIQELRFYPAQEDGMRGFEMARWPRDGTIMHHGSTPVYRIAHRPGEVEITDIDEPEADKIYYFSGVLKRLVDGHTIDFDPEVINKPGGRSD